MLAFQDCTGCQPKDMLALTQLRWLHEQAPRSLKDVSSVAGKPSFASQFSGRNASSEWRCRTVYRIGPNLGACEVDSKETDLSLREMLSKKDCVICIRFIIAHVFTELP